MSQYWQSGNQTGGSYPNTNSPPPSPKTSFIQTLTPLTVKQLYAAIQSQDVFQRNGYELNQVTIVGIINKLIQHSQNIVMDITDSTGSIEVRVWFDENDKNDFLASQKDSWVEDKWVRVTGHLRSFNDKRNIVAFRVTPIEDFNEIVYHNLEVIYVDMYQIAIEQKVMSVLRNSNQQVGVHLSIIFQELQHMNVSQSEIKRLLDCHIKDGKVFPTVEEHYALTPALTNE